MEQEWARPRSHYLEASRLLVLEWPQVEKQAFSEDHQPRQHSSQQQELRGRLRYSVALLQRSQPPRNHYLAVSLQEELLQLKWPLSSHLCLVNHNSHSKSQQVAYLEHLTHNQLRQAYSVLQRKLDRLLLVYLDLLALLK